MKAEKRLMEYYFYHYTDNEITYSKKLSAFKQSLFPIRDMFEDLDYSDGNTDALKLIMDKVITATYQNFRDKKRWLIKSRYFMCEKRKATCEKLDISPRTYHRYLDEVLDFAKDYLQVLLIEKAEYEKQLKFLSNYKEKELPPLEYLSSNLSQYGRFEI